VGGVMSGPNGKVIGGGTVVVGAGAGDGGGTARVPPCRACARAAGGAVRSNATNVTRI